MGTKPQNSRNPKGMKDMKNRYKLTGVAAPKNINRDIKIQIQRNRRGVTLKKLEIFHTIRRQYAILGISSSNQWTQEYPLNERILLIFIFLECVIVSQFMYTFRLSHGFLEFMEGTCTTAGSALIFVCFAAVVFRQTTLFEGIGNFEKLINSSKTTASFI